MWKSNLKNQMSACFACTRLVQNQIQMKRGMAMTILATPFPLIYKVFTCSEYYIDVHTMHSNVLRYNYHRIAAQINTVNVFSDIHVLNTSGSIQSYSACVGYIFTGPAPQEFRGSITHMQSLTVVLDLR